jgi:hypothetical protein
VINTTKGLASEIRVDLNTLAKILSPSPFLVDFLLRRFESKPLLLNHIKQLVLHRASLSELSRLFKKLNAVLQAHPEEEKYDMHKDPKVPPFAFLTSVGGPTTGSQRQFRESLRNIKRDSNVVITQSDMHRDVFLDSALDNEEVRSSLLP